MCSRLSGKIGEKKAVVGRDSIRPLVENTEVLEQTLQEARFTRPLSALIVSRRVRLFSARFSEGSQPPVDAPAGFVAGPHIGWSLGMSGNAVNPAATVVDC